MHTPIMMKLILIIILEMLQHSRMFSCFDLYLCVCELFDLSWDDFLRFFLRFERFYFADAYHHDDGAEGLMNEPHGYLTNDDVTNKICYFFKIKKTDQFISFCWKLQILATRYKTKLREICAWTIDNVHYGFLHHSHPWILRTQYGKSSW